MQIVFALLLLALAAAATRGPLQAQATTSALAAFASVLPASYCGSDMVAERVEISDPAALGSEAPMPLWRVRRGGEICALVIDAIASGYGGPLRLRIGLAPDGTLLGTRVIEHRETRGLGDAFEHDDGRWLTQLAGRSLADPPDSRWALRRDGGEFDQFSHATVTPRAILARVKAVLLAYSIQRDRWLTLAPAA